MNSIYIKYTYIALYLGRALFSLSHFKNEVVLPSSVVQPSSSQLAKLCLRRLERRRGVGRPLRGVPAPRPRPEAAGEGSLVRVWVSVRIPLFLGRGGGFVLILVLYVLFCCSLILYRCQEGGQASRSPNKLSHSS